VKKVAEDKLNPNSPQAPTAESIAQAAQKDATKPPSNAVSDQTGQFDTRFMLWRAFCARYQISVDTLPSELTGEAREAWDKMKDNSLHKPVEGK
jgi:hypothetical protein